MKEFVVYTALRLVLFLASLGVVAGAWALISDSTQVPVLWTVLIAFLVSGVVSMFALNRQREAFARRVQSRAEAATARFEELKAREDAEEAAPGSLSDGDR